MPSGRPDILERIPACFFRRMEVNGVSWELRSIRCPRKLSREAQCSFQRPTGELLAGKPVRCCCSNLGRKPRWRQVKGRGAGSGRSPQGDLLPEQPDEEGGSGKGVVPCEFRFLSRAVK